MDYKLFENLDDILTVEEARKALKIGRNTMYKLLKISAIKSIRLNGRKKYYIPKTSLIDYINNAIENEPYLNYNNIIDLNSGLQKEECINEM